MKRSFEITLLKIIRIERLDVAQEMAPAFSDRFRNGWSSKTRVVVIDAFPLALARHLGSRIAGILPVFDSNRGLDIAAR